MSRCSSTAETAVTEYACQRQRSQSAQTFLTRVRQPKLTPGDPAGKGEGRHHGVAPQAGSKGDYQGASSLLPWSTLYMGHLQQAR